MLGGLILWMLLMFVLVLMIVERLGLTGMKLVLRNELFEEWESR